MNTLLTSEFWCFGNRSKFRIVYLWIFVFRFSKLRLLDFRKIRQKDRKAAIELFKSKKGKEILKEIAKKAKAAAANPMAAESNYSKGNCNRVFLIFFSIEKKNAIHLQAIQRHRPMFNEFVMRSKMQHLCMKLNDSQEYYSPAKFPKIFPHQKMEMVKRQPYIRLNNAKLLLNTNQIFPQAIMISSKWIPLLRTKSR